MKTMNVWKCLGIALMLFAGSANAGAQDLKSILSGVVKSVVGDKTTTSTTIVGTWSYDGPACNFESDNLLAQAGSTVASSTVESKLESIYNKVGLSSSEFTFNEDETFSVAIKGKTVTGTYTFDDEAKTISMKTKVGMKFTANVTVTGSSMDLTFNVDKLMTVLKTITSAASSLSTTASTISTLAENYDGMTVGFTLKQ